MITLLVNVVVSLLGLALGGYVLLFGRNALSATLGIIVLASASNLAAVLVADLERGRDLVEAQAWLLLGVVAALTVLGVVLGRYRTDLAADAIGFVAGANIAVWLFELAEYLVIAVASFPPQTMMWVGSALAILSGLLGVWLVRHDRDEALILVSVLVGVEIIQDALGLTGASALTAFVLLALMLAGVLVQYGMYLRMTRPASPAALQEPEAAGLAFLQELDLG